MKLNYFKRLTMLTMVGTLVFMPCTAVLAGSSTPSATGGSQSGSTSTVAQEVVSSWSTISDTSVGGGVKSAVSGVYILQKGIGCAIKTTPEAIKESYKLEAGQSVYAKVYDMDVKSSYLAKKCMDDAAAAYGAKTCGFINMEVGVMTRGKYQALPDDGAAISVTFDIPDASVENDATYIVICVREGGQVTILSDLDKDSATVTIDTTADPAAYAIAYY